MSLLETFSYRQTIYDCRSRSNRSALTFSASYLQQPPPLRPQYVSHLAQPPACNDHVVAPSGSVCIMKSFGAPGTENSYGPWCTTGRIPAKLSCGGGVAVDHSSVVASHGLSVALAPLNMLQKRLK